MKLILWSFLFTSSALAQDCSFERLNVSFQQVGETKILRTYAHGFRFDFLNAENRDTQVAKGPLEIFVEHGKQVCKVEGGTFENVAYYSHPKKLLILKTYTSGSAGEFRVYDSKTCKEVGVKASFDGNAVFDSPNSKLVSEPACVPSGFENLKPLSSCISAKVFNLDSKTCTFVFNESESKALTKEKVGQILPFNKTTRIEVKSENICDGIHDVFVLTEEFEKTGKAKTAEQILAIAKKFKKSPASEKCKGASSFYEYLDRHPKTTARALKGDRVAIRYLFGLMLCLDGAAAEGLDIDLGKTIVKYPKLFLENLKEVHGEEFCSGGLLRNNGEYDEDEEQEKAMLKNRKKALLTVKDTSLLKIRDVCVSSIDRMLE